MNCSCELLGSTWGFGEVLPEPVCACVADIESFLLFLLHSFLTLLIAPPAPLFSPLTVFEASSPMIESAENRLDAPLGRGGLAEELASLYLGGGSSSWEGNRPNGSGDNGMSGTLSCRVGGTALNEPSIDRPCVPLAEASILLASCECFLTMDALGVAVETPFNANRGGDGG